MRRRGACLPRPRPSFGGSLPCGLGMGSLATARCSCNPAVKRIAALAVKEGMKEGGWGWRQGARARQASHTHNSQFQHLVPRPSLARHSRIATFPYPLLNQQPATILARRANEADQGKGILRPQRARATAATLIGSTRQHAPEAPARGGG